jgi:hypothetical protein
MKNKNYEKRRKEKRRRGKTGADVRGRRKGLDK